MTQQGEERPPIRILGVLDGKTPELDILAVPAVVHEEIVLVGSCDEFQRLAILQAACGERDGHALQHFAFLQSVRLAELGFPGRLGRGLRLPGRRAGGRCLGDREDYGHRNLDFGEQHGSLGSFVDGVAAR